MTAMEVGAQVARHALADAKVDPQKIDEVFVGQVLQAGCGQNPARQVALGAGVHDGVSAVTVNKVCGSGLQAVMFADQAIRAGDAQVVLAGGMESMSGAPFLLRNMRGGQKFGHDQAVDEMLYDGLTNAYDGALMGELAEYTADKAGISREAQDAWSLRSQQRAAHAWEKGYFAGEVAPIELPRGKGTFEKDETFRADSSLDGLAGLKPAFRKDGTVTAGNASQLSDGAGMVLVMSEAAVKETGVQPLARIAGQATAGGPPRDLFFTPPQAARMALDKAGWQIGDVQLWELNEAFASQTLAGLQALELPTSDDSPVNVHGGAIALGHPIGASGARVLVTLVHALKKRGEKKGLAALCLGGGNAVAMAIETV
jgi:acetyl-CoA C-acetyltransferase